MMIKSQSSKDMACQLRTESGYVVLAVLVLLVGAGSVWLSASSGSVVSAAIGFATVKERQGLVDARQSLLSYAALYASLYGPSGAGPGHLPCPDTDGFNLDHTSFVSGSDQTRDGANPPCASLIESSGLLPRHTVLPGYRYLFHAEPWQRYRYTVSGSFVNNPLNRLVNLEHLTDRQQNTLAVLSLLSSNEQLAASSPITAKALLRAVSAAVADWVMLKSLSYNRSACSQHAVASQAQASQESNASNCRVNASQTPDCAFDDVLLLIIDSPFAPSDDCILDILDSISIEGIPARRHWFVRNRWFESIVISSDDACVSDDKHDSQCLLVYLKQGGLSVLADSVKIVMRWSAEL